MVVGYALSMRFTYVVEVANNCRDSEVHARCVHDGFNTRLRDLNLQHVVLCWGKCEVGLVEDGNKERGVWIRENTFVNEVVKKLTLADGDEIATTFAAV